MRASPAWQAIVLTAAFFLHSPLLAQSRKAPPGTFKYLDAAAVGRAIILNGKQLFVDDFIVGEVRGVRKQLNQPVKHPKNPVLKRDKPWEVSGPGYATVIYDAKAQRFKIWYENWGQALKSNTSNLLYATSKDGIHWVKEIVDKKGGTNRVQQPSEYGFVGSGIFLDSVEQDRAKRYKMLFSCKPDKTAKSLMTSAAYSADGIHWKTYPNRKMIPFADTQNCPFWDSRRRRYVAILRFGPPNVRIVSRTESEDFLHWSPKITVLRRTKMDGPLNTQFYQMAPFSYFGAYFGLIAAYHNESLKPITPEQPWTDRKNLQLSYSRDGITWSRVGKQGAIPSRELDQKKNWKQIALDAVFLPYGKRDKQWDWGTVSPVFTPTPIIVKDEIWFYYTGINAKNWWTWAGDPPKRLANPPEPSKGIGLATLRLDGFVSVTAGAAEGTLTTKPLVFLGDTLVVNANAKGGSLTVAALDTQGKVIQGFGNADCLPLTTDSVRHVLKWRKKRDCHLLQGRPIKLRFHLKNSQLYSFEPRNRNNHYLQSYD